jgi:hypothetical protein
MTTAQRIANLKPNTPVKSWRKDKKMVVLAKLGVFGCLDELFKDLFLVVHGSMHTFPDLLIDVACEGFGQK